MRLPNPQHYESDWDYYEACEAYQASLTQSNNDEYIDPDEWDEFCEEVLVCNRRDYEDQTWLYGRKDV